MFKTGFEKTAGLFDSIKKAFTAAKAAPANSVTTVKPAAQAAKKIVTKSTDKIPSYIRDGVRSGKIKYIDVN